MFLEMTTYEGRTIISVATHIFKEPIEIAQ